MWRARWSGPTARRWRRTSCRRGCPSRPRAVRAGSAARSSLRCGRAPAPGPAYTRPPRRRERRIAARARRRGCSERTGSRGRVRPRSRTAPWLAGGRRVRCPTGTRGCCVRRSGRGLGRSSPRSSAGPRRYHRTRRAGSRARWPGLRRQRRPPSRRRTPPAPTRPRRGPRRSTPARRARARATFRRPRQTRKPTAQARTGR